MRRQAAIEREGMPSAWARRIRMEANETATRPMHRLSKRRTREISTIDSLPTG